MPICFHFVRIFSWGAVALASHLGCKLIVSAFLISYQVWTYRKKNLDPAISPRIDWDIVGRCPSSAQGWLSEALLSGSSMVDCGEELLGNYSEFAVCRGWSYFRPLLGGGPWFYLKIHHYFLRIEMMESWLRRVSATILFHAEREHNANSSKSAAQETLSFAFSHPDFQSVELWVPIIYQTISSEYPNFLDDFSNFSTGSLL